VTSQADAGDGPELLRLTALGPLKALFQAKRWSELEAVVGDVPVWAFDRPLPPRECRRFLAELFDPAVDLHVLVTAHRARGNQGGEVRSSFRCCVVWGEAGSWEEHEMELDLHLGSKPDGAGMFRVCYLGVSGR
jgi:hypothetical protein